MNKMMSFSFEEFKEFKKIYEQKAAKKEETFTFKEEVFLTEFAKYVVEYLEEKFAAKS